MGYVFSRKIAVNTFEQRSKHPRGGACHAELATRALSIVDHREKCRPGWSYWNEWQCGPYVRIVVSIDGKGGTDFFVRGAWFDNHYTLRSNGLFYNGIACVEVRPSRLPRGWVGHGPVVE